MECTCSSLIVKWIYLSFRLHWVITTPQFDQCIFRVHRWLSSISVLERSSLAQGFVSTFTPEYIELPSLKTLCWTATWFLVPSASLFIQTRFTLWLLLLWIRKNFLAWIWSTFTGIWSGTTWLDLNYLICLQGMRLTFLDNNFRYLYWLLLILLIL